jgi:hypothetical protein
VALATSPNRSLALTATCASRLLNSLIFVAKLLVLFVRREQIGQRN